APSIDRSTKPA
nr:Chain B, LYMPHOCYTE CYTOSOLIC PROTEIN 2 [Homo sapiens]